MSKANGRNGKPPPDAPERALWERRDNETDESWQAFVAYRDMLDEETTRRSLAKVARRLSKSKPLMQRWSERHDWVRRAAAYDRDQDAIKRAAQATELVRRVKRQGNSLDAAAMALVQPIEAYLKRVAQLRQESPDGDPFAGLSLAELGKEAREAARLIPQLIQVERLVHGLSTENVAVTGSISVEDARRQARSKTRAELEELLAGPETVEGSAAE